jgi:hypothetical protein
VFTAKIFLSAEKKFKHNHSPQGNELCEMGER